MYDRSRYHVSRNVRCRESAINSSRSARVISGKSPPANESFRRFSVTTKKKPQVRRHIAFDSDDRLENVYKYVQSCVCSNAFKSNASLPLLFRRRVFYRRFTQSPCRVQRRELRACAQRARFYTSKYRNAIAKSIALSTNRFPRYGRCPYTRRFPVNVATRSSVLSGERVIRSNRYILVERNVKIR